MRAYLVITTLILSSAPLRAAAAAPRLVIHAVTTEGNLPSWKARQLLRRQARSPLGCHIVRPGNRASLAGSIRVEATIGKDGRLGGVKLSASGEHRALETCAAGAIRRWLLSADKQYVGARVRFSFYVSFSTATGILGALRAARGRGAGAPGGVVGGVVGGVGVGGLGLRGTGTYTRYRSSATIDGVTASGSLQQGVVTWAVQQLRLESNIRYCQQTAVRDDPKVGGRYQIALRVGKNGGLEKLELVKDSVGNVSLQSCVMRYLVGHSSYGKTTPFPASSGTTDVALSLTFPAAKKTD